MQDYPNDRVLSAPWPPRIEQTVRDILKVLASGRPQASTEASKALQSLPTGLQGSPIPSNWPQITPKWPPSRPETIPKPPKTRPQAIQTHIGAGGRGPPSGIRRNQGEHKPCSSTIVGTPQIVRVFRNAFYSSVEPCRRIIDRCVKLQ